MIAQVQPRINTFIQLFIGKFPVYDWWFYSEIKKRCSVLCPATFKIIKLLKGYCIMLCMKSLNSVMCQHLHVLQHKDIANALFGLVLGVRLNVRTNDWMQGSIFTCLRADEYTWTFIHLEKAFIEIYMQLSSKIEIL